MFKYEVFILFCFMGVQDESCVVHRNMFDTLGECKTEFMMQKMKADLFGEKMKPVAHACLKRSVEKMLKDRA